MARIPILDPPLVVEQRAEQISDPVERLRYLRQEMRPQPSRRPVVSRSVARNGAFAFALVALIGLLPLPTGTAETLAKERKLIVSEVTNTANAPLPHVWMVDHSDALEVYSNGLRIDLTFTVANHPRRPFPIFSVPGGVRQGEGDKPVGIVFHTTESLLAPFEEQQNRRLRQIGRSLIEIVRSEHSYHYLIDRFGRVYRVVQESDAANHAGVSIWADSQGAYVNLNNSFIGISFEGQTGAINEMTQAQITSGKVLTEMLRSKYGISTEDCVTHAQVSVNPQNMKIGSHTDWADKFPFAGVGLPNNYAIPLASLYAFGFNYDSVFLRVTGTRWRGLDIAETWVTEQAAAEGLDTRRYRAILQHRYKEIENALREKSGEILK